MAAPRAHPGEPITAQAWNQMAEATATGFSPSDKPALFNREHTNTTRPSFQCYTTMREPYDIRVMPGWICVEGGTPFLPEGMDARKGKTLPYGSNVYLTLYTKHGEENFEPGGSSQPSDAVQAAAIVEEQPGDDRAGWIKTVIMLSEWKKIAEISQCNQRWASDIFISKGGVISGGSGESLWSLSMVPGPGIDIERTTETAEDGTDIIVYKVSGRLSQYKNYYKPNEQGDIVGITVAINPQYEPRLETGASILDGHINISITPGPMVSLVPGSNIEITTDNTHTASGYPLIVYTISTKGGGESISITPGPGIRIDDTTASSGHPITLRIAKNFDISGHSGINVTEQTDGNHVQYDIGLDVSALSVVPGPVVDADRPPEALTTPEMIANGWTQVSGSSQDPIGHTHALFMAIRNGKIYMSMLYPLQ